MTEAVTENRQNDEAVFLYAANTAEYPPESIDDFSIEPIEFEEAAAIMTDDMHTMFGMTAAYNRRSPQFLDSSNRLLEMMKDLAGCCVTKEALLSKGISLTGNLSLLSTGTLYKMASFNFRKCHAAFDELSKDLARISCHSMLDLERRWYGLMDRLKATEEKIEKIRSGKISVDEMLKQAYIFRKEKKSRGIRVINHKPLGEKKTSSFPILRATAAERAGRMPSAMPFAARPFPAPSKFQAPKDMQFPANELAEQLRKKKEPAELSFSEEEMESLCAVWEKHTGTKAPVEAVAAARRQQPAAKKKKKKR